MALSANLDIQQILLAIGFTLGTAVVANYLVRKWRKNRRLRQKIAHFRQQEQLRRNEIRKRAANASATNLTDLPFAVLVEKLRHGKLSASEVLIAYQETALRVNDDLNAVTEFIYTANETAQALDRLDASKKRPLHGVPFSVKECYLIKGTEATIGYSQYLGEYTQGETATVIQFLQELGAVPFVKTNLPQGCFSFDSVNPIHGQTKNPRDLTRSPAGSSSGEGALIAGKASLFGIGSDSGGSLRAPAAWCGAYALKPGSNRMLQGGDLLARIEERIISADYLTPGFMARDIETLVTLHKLLYSQSTFDRFPLNQMTPVVFRDDILESKQPLTIGYCDFDGITELVPAMKRALNEAKEQLERRGHRLVHWQDTDMLKEMYLAFCNTLTIDGVEDVLKALEDDIEISHPNQLTYWAFKIPNWMRSIFRLVASFTMGDLAATMISVMMHGTSPQDLNHCYSRLLRCREKFYGEFSKAKLDALLWPAMPCPALPLDSPSEIPTALSYLILFDFLNWPAGVCPFGNVTDDDVAKMELYPTDSRLRNDIYHIHIKKFFAKSSSPVGLPLAVQIAAPQFKEELVLRLMKELGQKTC